MDKISKLDLKTLTKLVLKEISIPAAKPSRLQQLLGMKTGDWPPNPITSDVNEASLFAQNLIKQMSKFNKEIIQFYLKGEKEKSAESSARYIEYQDDIIHLSKRWIENLAEKSPEKLQAGYKIYNELIHHLSQVSGQTRTIIRTMTPDKNYISALKGIRHLDEITNNVNISVGQLFQLMK